MVEITDMALKFQPGYDFFHLSQIIKKASENHKIRYKNIFPPIEE